MAGVEKFPLIQYRSIEVPIYGSTVKIANAPPNKESESEFRIIIGSSVMDKSELICQRTSIEEEGDVLFEVYGT